MKLTQGIDILRSKDVKKTISKKILLANTQDKITSEKVLKHASGMASDPLYNDNPINAGFNPDIRYRNMFNYSPLTGINYRNDLLLFAENSEVKKAVNIVANETCIIDTEQEKYPVQPKINLTKVSEEKQKTAKAMDEYLNDVFFPQLLQMYNFKDDGFIEVIEEFLITGKLCYEIIYDNLKNPKNIIGLQPLDPSTIQKFKQGEYIYYVQRPIAGDTRERVLSENQIVLCEWNRYDFGYISYVDKLRRAFNIMRSMQTSKALWFAAKSQIKMHIKLALGDVGHAEAYQKLVESKNQYTNQFTLQDDGVVTFNNQPNNNAYREFFTGETTTSGTPEIEEVNSNGPDLTEIDSLSYWAKLYWGETEVPIDRIDPNATDSWGFTDVNNLRKIEINFAKFINRIRKMLNPLFIKPIIIQLTLKEIEIGIDLTLLDSIKMQWYAFNQYESLAELELLNKKVEIAGQISNFGDLEDVNGNVRKMIPLAWIIRNQLGFSEETIRAIEKMRREENILLGFEPDDTRNFMEEGTDMGTLASGLNPNDLVKAGKKAHQINAEIDEAEEDSENDEWEDDEIPEDENNFVESAENISNVDDGNF